MADPELDRSVDDEDAPSHPDQKILGDSGLRTKHAARVFIVAMALAFVILGIVTWLGINGISEMHSEFTTNHHDRIVQEAKLRKSLHALQNENKDLACSTRAFFLQRAKPGTPEPPFLVFLNKRYHCRGFRLTP